jgi:hypothetical protein
MRPYEAAVAMAAPKKRRRLGEVVEEEGMVSLVEQIITFGA